MTLTANYDEQKLLLQSGVNGSALNKLSMTPPGRYKNGCKFTWYHEALLIFRRCDIIKKSKQNVKKEG